MIDIIILALPFQPKTKNKPKNQILSQFILIT